VAPAQHLTAGRRPVALKRKTPSATPERNRFHPVRETAINNQLKLSSRLLPPQDSPLSRLLFGLGR
jgi:hypothetical protein